MTEQAIQQLAKDYDTACSNYCKYMIKMWNKEVTNDYLDDVGTFLFTIDGMDFSLEMYEVMYIVHNEVPYAVVAEWSEAVQDEKKEHVPLFAWVAKNLNDL